MKLTVQYYDDEFQYREEVWTFNENDESEMRFEKTPVAFIYGFSDEKKKVDSSWGIDWYGEPSFAGRVLSRCKEAYPNVSPYTSDTINACMPDSTVVVGAVSGYPVVFRDNNDRLATRFRYLFTGGYIFEGGEGDLEVVKEGIPLRIIGDRYIRFSSDALDHNSSNFWRKGIDEILDFFDTKSREMLASKKGGHFDFDVLCTESNPLIDENYLLGKATVGELRTYFMDKYNQVPMFNFQLSNELAYTHRPVENESTKALIAKVACESNFVVFHGAIAKQEGNRASVVDMNLLDGFMRILWAGNPDDVVFFKFYHGLSEHKRLRLMMAANYWKSLESNAELFFDRGMRLFVFNETGVFMDIGFVKRYMAPYTDFSGGGKLHNDRFYLDMWDNGLMLKDIVLLDKLSRYRDQKDRPLVKELINKIVRAIGNFRRHKSGHDVELAYEQILRILDVNLDYFDKLNGMCVGGMIDKNIADNFTPRLKELFTAIIEGRDGEHVVEPVIKPKQARKKKGT